MKLKRGESIVTAYAQSASGPGWANTPIWVIVRKADQTLREECIQPLEQTEWMHRLYRVSQEVHLSMLAAVCASVKKR